MCCFYFYNKQINNDLKKFSVDKNALDLSNYVVENNVEVICGV